MTAEAIKQLIAAAETARDAGAIADANAIIDVTNECVDLLNKVSAPDYGLQFFDVDTTKPN
jgi:hypothetical protein